MNENKTTIRKETKQLGNIRAKLQRPLQTENEICAALFAMQDENYRDFHAKLIPNVDKETIIGVRVPHMRAYARTLWKQAPETARAFLEVLPHKYYEENCLHGLLIDTLAETTDEALRLIDRFLPYVDNWATCDMLPPKIFASDLARVRETVLPWLSGDETYRARFTIVTLLTFFLEEETFEPEDLLRLAEIHSEEYYVNMAIAWYYSFALIKQYERTVGLFESKTLAPWVQNKSIQKAIESYRIAPERKAYLWSLKIKG